MRMQIRKIKSIKHKKSSHVYDLNVPKNHNFFIGTGELLTHNCDFMTINGQAALRNIMEEYHKYSRFILTCNFKNKILDALVSRCQCFEYSAPPKKEILKRALHILKAENIKVSGIEQVAEYVRNHGSDIRGLVGNLQKNSITGTLNNFSSLSNDGKKYIELIKSMSYTNFVDTYNNDNIDPAEILRMIFNNADDISSDNAVEIRIACGEGLRWHSNVVDTQINMLTTVLEIMSVIA